MCPNIRNAADSAVPLLGFARRRMPRTYVLLLLPALLASLGCGECPAPESGADAAAWDTFLAEAKRVNPMLVPPFIIRHFFRDRPAGFFVDVGASHFRQWNNTYFLEQNLAWSGIAIDALAKYGPDYEKKRPRTKFFAYIVTDHTSTEETFYHTKGDLGSTAVKERAITVEKFLPVDEIKVPAITLNDLLTRAGVTKIDLLAMDIEAGELPALAGFDIEKFAPELVCIEAFPEAQAALLKYFEKHGYRRIDRYLEYDAGNWFFTPVR